MDHEFSYLAGQETGRGSSVVRVGFGNRLIAILHVHSRPSYPHAFAAYDNRRDSGNEAAGTVNKN